MYDASSTTFGTVLLQHSHRLKEMLTIQLSCTATSFLAQRDPLFYYLAAVKEGEGHWCVCVCVDGAVIVDFFLVICQYSGPLQIIP